MDVTAHLRITGRVQGVGYRYSLLNEAVAAGLTGWVRNRHDGSVEAVLQGTREAIDKVIAWSRKGPPASRVDDVEVSLDPESRRYGGFEQRPTA